MQTYLRLYSRYITKLVLFFKQIIIINILFISNVYPLSNTNDQNLLNLTTRTSNSDSLIMQKAFEAEILVKNQEYDEAAKIFQDISMRTDDPEIAKRATQIAGYAGNYEMMLKSSERWLEITNDKITVRHIRISIFAALNKIDLAIKETLEAIKISKDKDRFALAYDTIKVFDDKIVNKEFEKVYAKYKDDYLANFYYVQILLNNKEYEKSIKLINSIDKFKEFSKKESRWGIFLAEAYYATEKKETAIKVLKDYLEYSPKDLYLNQYYVRLQTLQENYSEAIDHYRFMSANKLISFSDIDTAKKMAILNIKAKKFEDAKIFIESIKKVDINSFNYLTGLLKIENDKKKSALSFFKKVNNEDQNYFNAVKEIVKIKIDDEQYFSLKKFFKKEYKKLENKPDLEARLILIETEAFFNAKKFIYSMERINYGLKKYKDNGSFLYTRALVAEQIDRLDILEDDLKKLISLEPKNAQALNALGYTWANNNIKLKQANKYIDLALDIEPNDAAILDSKGWVLFKLGKYRQSEKYLTRALNLNKDTEIVSHVIQLYIKQNKIEKAKKLYLKHIKLHPKDEKLIELKKKLNEI